ncbi:hypothetical protein G7Y89_g13489 [Cudoniella acicularis]|uniref:Uncharacterized protein n=1 Tax=Cudoniella acicularis TaxID=354080 RepID=A0A8H4R757_9HELO|nr:hypothetical protein G7Y89_g13489 [Cudoniella acicularis]
MSSPATVPVSAEPSQEDGTKTISPESRPPSSAGFRLVEVQKPDGTIVTVKKPIKSSPANSTSAAKEEIETKIAKTGAGAVELPAVPEAAITKSPVAPPRFELAKVRKPDGRIVAVKKPIQVLAKEDADATVNKTEADAPRPVITEPASTTSNTPAGPNPPISGTLNAPTDPTKASKLKLTAWDHFDKAEVTFTPNMIFMVGTVGMSISNKIITTKAIQIEEAVVVEEATILEAFFSDSEDDDNHGKDGNNKTGNSTQRMGVKWNSGAAGRQRMAQSSSHNRAYTLPKPQFYEMSKDPYSVHVTSQPELTEKGSLNSSDGQGNIPLPENVQKLEAGYAHWSRWIIWAVEISFPLFYIILGIVIASLDTTPLVNSSVQNIKEAITVAITTWPITFAAITAQKVQFDWYRLDINVGPVPSQQPRNATNFHD